MSYFYFVRLHRCLHFFIYFYHLFSFYLSFDFFIPHLIIFHFLFFIYVCHFHHFFHFSFFHLSFLYLQPEYSKVDAMTIVRTFAEDPEKKLDVHNTRAAIIQIFNDGDAGEGEIVITPLFLYLIDSSSSFFVIYSTA